MNSLLRSMLAGSRLHVLTLATLLSLASLPAQAQNLAMIESLIEGHSAVMLLIRPDDGQILAANQAAREFYGYSAERLRQLRIDDINILSDAQVQAERDRATREERNYFIFAHQLANGDVRTVEVHSNPITVADESLLFSVIHDITDQLAAEQSLATYQTDLQQLVIQRTAELEAANARIQGIFFYSAVAAGLVIALLGLAAVQYRRLLMRARETSSQLKVRDEEAYELTYFDALTRLPNRQLLIDQLRTAQQLAVDGKHQYSLMLIDLDRFKDINDSRGHDAGDWLLQKVAARLLECTRASDTVARLGGDEFAVLSDISGEVPQQQRAHTANQAERLRRSLSLPYYQGNFEYYCTPSLGITVVDGGQHSVEESLRQAELALYKAKDRGGNALRFFDPDMQAETDQRTDLEQALRQALRNEDLELWYQPQVDTEGRLLGAEALLRWRHETQGYIPPDQFIPLAENSGIIDELGNWVLRQAFAQLEQWCAEELWADFVMSINISPRQFRQQDFARQVGRLLDQYSIQPQQIIFELTETALLDHMEDTGREMMLLQSSGIRFALDDFGTGYSSLSYLKRLPLAQLKIDKSFVQDVARDPNDAAIARSIIGLGQNLDIDVLAEGVEDESIYNFLVHAGCRQFQGYWFGRPVPAAQFRADWLSKRLKD